MDSRRNGYAREMSSIASALAIETTIVGPGRVTKGTNHFGAFRGRCEARVAEYDAGLQGRGEAC